MKKAISFLLTFCLIVYFIPFASMTVNAQTFAKPQLEGSFDVTQNTLYCDDQTQTADINISLEGKAYVSSTVVPNDIILVIDRSGSMSSSMSDMVTAAKNFVDKIDLTTHRIGVVAYDDSVLSMDLSRDASSIKSFITANCTANGGTYTELAISKASSLLSSKRASADGAIVLMTDGLANGDQTHVQKAEAAKAKGYIFYTVALCGSNSSINDELKQMATSEADHYSVFSSSQLNSVYQNIAGKIGYSYAKNVTITQTVNSKFEIVPDSASNNVPVPTIDYSKNTLTWKMNQLGQGTANLSYSIRAKKSASEGSFNHATGKITYTDYNKKTVSITLDPVKLTVASKFDHTSVTSVTPTTLWANEEMTVTVEGTDLDAATTITFDGKTPDGLSVSADKITFTAPAFAAGKAPVLKIYDDFKKGKSVTFSVVAKPQIKAVSPNKGVANATKAIQIKGKNFGSDMNTKVLIGDKAASVTAVSGTYIKCTVPKQAEGVYDVSVILPGCLPVTLQNGFTYGPPTASSTDPTITGITPNSGTEKAAHAIQIKGKNFGSDMNTKVLIGDKAATVTAVTNTCIKCKVPAQPAGNYDVTVTVPKGNPVTFAGGYTYTTKVLDPAPDITSISPASGTENAAHAIQINGKNFGSDMNTKVLIGDKAATVTAVTNTYIKCKVPAQAAGNYDVTVTVPNRSPATKAGGYTYTAKAPDPAPEITSISPASGTENAAHSIQINGKNFGSDMNTKVLIGDKAATVTAVSSTYIKCKVPAQAAGNYDVTVTVPNCSPVTKAGGYTYTAASTALSTPTVSALSSISTAAGTEKVITISGSGFGSDMNTVVKIGTEKATVNAVSDGSIRCTVPKLSAGTYDVTVIIPGCNPATLPNAFTYN